MTRMMPLIGIVLALSAPAHAQELNCAAPTTQVEMTGCASQAFEAADGDLNLAWSLASSRAKGFDAAAPGLDPSYFALLLDAQRAWIPFRDKACEAESTLARGGSIQNMLFYICLERLTRQRTEDLRFYGEAN